MAFSIGSLGLPIRTRKDHEKLVPPAKDKSPIHSIASNTNEPTSYTPSHPPPYAPLATQRQRRLRSANKHAAPGQSHQLGMKDRLRRKGDDNDVSAKDANKRQKRRDRKKMQRAKEATDEQIVKRRYWTLKERYGRALRHVIEQNGVMAGKLFCGGDITVAQYASIMMHYSINNVRTRLLAMAVKEESYNPTNEGRGMELLDEAGMKCWMVRPDEVSDLRSGVSGQEDSSEAAEVVWLANAVTALHIG